MFSFTLPSLNDGTCPRKFQASLIEVIEEDTIQKSTPKIAECHQVVRVIEMK